MYRIYINPLTVKFIKWSNTLKQVVGKLPTICLSVFDHFSGLALKGLRIMYRIYIKLYMSYVNFVFCVLLFCYFYF